MVPREPIIKDLLREVKASLPITEVLIHPRKIRSWLGEEERKVRGRKCALGRPLCMKNTGLCSRNLEGPQEKRRRSPMGGHKRGEGFETMLEDLLSILYLKNSKKPLNDSYQRVGIIRCMF